MSDLSKDNPDSSPEARGSGDGQPTPAADVPSPHQASVDSLDAKLGRTSIHDVATPTGGATRSEAYPAADPEFVYKMDYPSRGIFIVINNKTFDPSTQMNARTGTDQDAANLYTQFKKLGFEVHLYNNLRSEQMLKLVIEVAKMDHSQSDMFAMAILSHGDEGIVYGVDGVIPLDQLFAPIKGDKCATLVGKPKFMIIQACRGSSLDHGVEKTDAEQAVEKTYRIPTEADFLYAYSTTPGYFSWRNSTKGSWFVQALTQVLQEHGTREIMWILTRTNYLVAYEFQSNASKEFMNKKKQIPSIVSQLTKELYLTAKSK